MTISSADIEATLRAFLARANKPIEPIAATTPLYAHGIGLDSLETAELSALLEDEYGTDPFQTDTMPQTVGDILDFYRSVAVEV